MTMKLISLEISLSWWQCSKFHLIYLSHMADTWYSSKVWWRLVVSYDGICWHDTKGGQWGARLMGYEISSLLFHVMLHNIISYILLWNKYHMILRGILTWYANYHYKKREGLLKSTWSSKKVERFLLTPIWVHTTK